MIYALSLMALSSARDSNLRGTEYPEVPQLSFVAPPRGDSVLTMADLLQMELDAPPAGDVIVETEKEPTFFAQGEDPDHDVQGLFDIFASSDLDEASERKEPTKPERYTTEETDEDRTRPQGPTKEPEEEESDEEGTKPERYTTEETDEDRTRPQGPTKEPEEEESEGEDVEDLTDEDVEEDEDVEDDADEDHDSQNFQDDSDEKVTEAADNKVVFATRPVKKHESPKVNRVTSTPAPEETLKSSHVKRKVYTLVAQ